MFTEPKLGPGRSRAERLCKVSCASAQARSTAEYATTLPIALRATNAIPVATTTLTANCVMLLRIVAPILGGHLLCPCGYNYPFLCNQPVTHVIGAQSPFTRAEEDWGR